MRVLVSALLTTLLAVTARAQEDEASGVSVVTPPSLATSTSDATTPTTASVPPWVTGTTPSKCTETCEVYTNITIKCYYESLASRSIEPYFCKDWCETDNYNAMATCYNCKATGWDLDDLYPQIFDGYVRAAERNVKRCDPLPTSTLAITAPAGWITSTTGASASTTSAAASTTSNPTAQASSSPLTTVSASPSTTSDPSSGARLVAPTVVLLAVVAAVAMAL